MKLWTTSEQTVAFHSSARRGSQESLQTQSSDEMDSSETTGGSGIAEPDVEYGPGIVRRLAERFALLATSVSQSSAKSGQRIYGNRAASFDDLLDREPELRCGLDIQNKRSSPVSSFLDKNHSRSHSCLHSSATTTVQKPDFSGFLNDDKSNNDKTNNATLGNCSSKSISGTERKISDYMAQYLTALQQNNNIGNGSTSTSNNFSSKSDLINSQNKPGVGLSNSQGVVKSVEQTINNKPSFNKLPSTVTTSVEKEQHYQLPAPLNGFHKSLQRRLECDTEKTKTAPTSTAQGQEDITNSGSHVPEFVAIAKSLRPVPSLQRRPSATFKNHCSSFSNNDDFASLPQNDLLLDSSALNCRPQKSVNSTIAENKFVKKFIAQSLSAEQLQLASNGNSSNGRSVLSNSNNSYSKKEQQKQEKIYDTPTLTSAALRTNHVTTFTSRFSSANTTALSNTTTLSTNSSTPPVLKLQGLSTDEFNTESSTDAVVFGSALNGLPLEKTPEVQIRELAKVFGEVAPKRSSNPRNAGATRKALLTNSNGFLGEQNSIDKETMVKRRSLTSEHWRKKSVTVTTCLQASTSSYNNVENKVLLLKLDNGPSEVPLESAKPKQSVQNGHNTCISSDSIPAVDLLDSNCDSCERRRSLDCTVFGPQLDNLLSDIAHAQKQENGIESTNQVSPSLIDDWLIRSDDVITTSTSKVSRANIIAGSAATVVVPEPVPGPESQTPGPQTSVAPGLKADLDFCDSLETNGQHVEQQQPPYDDGDDDFRYDEIPSYLGEFVCEFLNAGKIVCAGIIKKSEKKLINTSLSWDSVSPKAYAYEIEETADAWQPGFEMSLDQYKEMSQKIKEEHAQRQEAFTYLLAGIDSEHLPQLVHGSLSAYMPNSLSEPYQLGMVCASSDDHSLDQKSSEAATKTSVAISQQLNKSASACNNDVNLEKSMANNGETSPMVSSDDAKWSHGDPELLLF